MVNYQFRTIYGCGVTATFSQPCGLPYLTCWMELPSMIRWCDIPGTDVKPRCFGGYANVRQHSPCPRFSPPLPPPTWRMDHSVAQQPERVAGFWMTVNKRSWLTFRQMQCPA